MLPQIPIPPKTEFPLQKAVVDETPLLSHSFFFAPESPSPLRVAAYIRVSTDSEVQEESYTNQVRYFSQLLSHHTAWVNAGIYADFGISGTQTVHWAGFNRLIHHCAQGKIDRILCKSISRFSRNTLDCIETLKELKGLGVTCYFEKEALDTKDTVSDFILTTLAAVAQEESRSASASIRWGMEKRHPKGQVPNAALYGYRFVQNEVPKDGSYHCREVQTIEEEAAVVRRIFSMFLSGKGLTEIARQLNREGISPPPTVLLRCPNRRSVNDGIDQGWLPSRVRWILTSERYCGDVLIRKTYTPDFLTHRRTPNKAGIGQYYAMNHHPSIISRDVYLQAQSIFAARKTGTKQHHTHGFSGRVVCAHCGRFYHVRNTRYHPIWFCPSAANGAKDICHAEKIYESQLLQTVRQALAERFSLFSKLPAIWEPFVATDCFVPTAADFLPKLIHQLESLDQWECFDISRTPEQIRRELDYPLRQKAIGWMKSLPVGTPGTAAFFSQFSDAYVGAFVLSVTVHNTRELTVRWFDGLESQIDL